VRDISSDELEVVQYSFDEVDLLVMVDNSNSMAQEQAHLTEEFQTIIDGLTRSVTDLHVGVISSDVGTGGFAVQTCDNPWSGDDGILVDTSEVPGCGGAYPRFLTFAEGNDPAEIAADFACIATLGTGGCGFEQQLKAVRHALTRNVGEGQPNEGFLRESSLLAILMVTDEEDCSVYEDVEHPTASDIFNVNLPLGSLNLRCFQHRDMYVEPVSSYVDDILALRPDEPERIVAAAIVGIPPSVRHPCSLQHMTDADFQCVLDLPDMQEVIDNSAEGKGERLTPSCDEPGLGEAFPPRRIVEFVRQINQVGSSGIVRSICEENFQPALEAITRLVESKVFGECLARPLDVHPIRDQVQCILREETASAGACLPGRIDLGLAGSRRLCQICQEGDGLEGRETDDGGTDVRSCGPFNAQGHFWRYLSGAETGGQCPDTGKVEFVGDATPLRGATVTLKCRPHVVTE
jgi:hypothetical protein